MKSNKGRMVGLVIIFVIGTFNSPAIAENLKNIRSEFLSICHDPEILRDDDRYKNCSKEAKSRFLTYKKLKTESLKAEMLTDVCLETADHRYLSWPIENDLRRINGKRPISIRARCRKEALKLMTE